jgi:hypothetical protein
MWSEAVATEPEVAAGVAGTCSLDLDIALALATVGSTPEVVMMPED